MGSDVDVVFEQNFDGTYDLKVDRRTREYDVAPEDLKAALRRARIPTGEEVFVEDETGYRTRLS